ncbi:MAG: hypothetical protein FJW14_15060 [Acidimicrobiia bacterium]|nr:hypothetical protein [Acidimicrobiia bacterium]
MDYYNWTDPVDLTFFVLPLLLVLTLIAGVYAASRRLAESRDDRRLALIVTIGGAAVWLMATWINAMRGTLRLWTELTPPPFAYLVAGILLLAVAISSGSYGRRLAHGLPLWILVGIQGFRLPLEIAMHAMYERGVMPVQMSYSGRNFDIVTGATALVVAALVWKGRAGRRVVLAWNILGLALLVNIMVIAILSTPRFMFWGPRATNFFVAYPPFVWLPAVMVLAALAGHLLIFRALRRA